MAVTRLEEFDLWRPGYGYAVVTVLIAGTTQDATIYTDEALTQQAANPQTLIQQSFGGISYGKWSVPLYVGTPYELSINSVDRTGVVTPPLTTLVGQDASEATVIPTGGTVAGNLDDILGRTIDVLDYGPFIALNEQNASAITNTNSLAAAIGQCGAEGGGSVIIPAGTFQITDVVLPTGVVIVGEGREASTLQSTLANTPVIKVSGARAGLRRCGIDGLNQVNNSIGLFGEVVDQIILEDVLVQRFDVGIRLYGGNGNHWKDLYVSDCLIGYQGHGYSDAGNGGPLQQCSWDGGIIDTCSTAGIELENVDELTDHNSFIGLQFNDNTGIAFHLIGARSTVICKCTYNGNTTDLQLEDTNPLDAAGDNTVIGFDCRDTNFIGTGANGAAINLEDTLKNVAFRRCEFTNETITLTSPGNNVLEQDCRQISGVSFAGTATAWIVSKTYDSGKTLGLTTGNAATQAWSLALQDGQYCLLKARVVARSRSTTDFAFFELIIGAYCTGASLGYDAQSANFTAGDVLTGATSGATARVLAATNSGATGTLTLIDVDGTFVNNEVITDTGNGKALVNGTLTHGTATLDTVTTVHSTNASSFACAFAVSNQEVFLNVTGLSSNNIEWFTNVDVISSQQLE